MMVEEKPPAEITAEVFTATGEGFRWDPAARNVEKRPLDIAFETEAGEGFASSSVTLRRPGDQEYADLSLLNELRLNTGGGQRAYEGRAQGVPVGEAWQFDCEGWMSHGRQRTFTDFLVERDTSQLGEISTYRRQVLLAFTQTLDKAYTVAADRALNWTGEAGQSIPAGSRAELAYIAPLGTRIGKVMYQGTQGNAANVAAPDMVTADDDQINNQVTYGMTLDGTLRTINLTDSKRAFVLGALASATHTPAATAGFWRTIALLATYNESGVPTITRDGEPDGIAASDGITYLANKYAPKLSTAGVEATSYPIPHATWRDPVTFHEAAKQLNSFHGWRLGVWENRTLEFGPYDLTTSNWQVRNGINGVRVETPGDTTENIFNGVCVTFTDFTGVQQRITPLDAADLHDTSDWIAANQWGDQAWFDLPEITWRCSKNDAVAIGAIALTEANRAKRPSTITVPMYIQDIEGHWQPSSLVRADQTISVLNQHSPTPRKITKTSWRNHELTVTTDNAVGNQEALNARIIGALQAAGLM
ncbi:MAG TPA: hypothetical protein VMF31_10560 [Solirubrobacterales bacterium]|nr:hypothetical protein [Solirubrobacterales bacterium]